MTDSALTSTERELAIESVRVLAEGSFIDDWELPIVTPFKREELEAIYRRIKADGVIDDDASIVAIGACLNNLARYPHRQDAQLELMLGCSMYVLEQLCEKWHAQDWYLKRRREG